MSTDGWKQGLQHLQQRLREYARDFERAPAACHAFWSPEPMRQHRYFPDASDFYELYTLHHGHFSDRVQSSCHILRQNQKSVETLYTLLPKAQCDNLAPGNYHEKLAYSHHLIHAALRNYQSTAGELLDIIFGGEEQARKLLGLDPTENRLSPSSLWTLVLFRLATQRIDGFGLSPLDARNDENVFQTLWPEAPSLGGQYESISFDDPTVSEQLLLPKLYKGAVWVLSEISGKFHVPPSESLPSGESIPCTIRFSPPLLLFNSSAVIQESPTAQPPVCYAWTGGNDVQTVSITRPDGSPVDGFSVKRIRGLGLLLSLEGCRKDDCFKDRSQFVGDAAICEVKLRPPTEAATMISHSTPLRIIFVAYDDAKDVYLLVTSDESKESHLPLLQPLKSTVISSRSFSLTGAEKLLESIRAPEDSNFGVSLRHEYLPQQRITNVVQILENLFDASSKAVAIVLAKGRDWIRDNMSRTAPVFAEAWREGEYSSAECRALVERIRESANTSDGQDGDADGSLKDGNSLRFPSDSDYDGQISLIPPKRRQGRHRHLRRAWIQERLDEGLEVEGIINAWNQGGPELWKKIDPKDPNPYLVKTSDQLNASKKRIRSLISRMEEDKEKEKQNSTGK